MTATTARPSTEVFTLVAVSTLTATQAEIVQSVLDLVHHYGSQTEFGAAMAVLEGAAGTGKTTTMVELIASAVQQGLEVAVAAPTHKAANVLNEKLVFLKTQFPEAGIPLATTVHSLLKLKPRRSSENGAETFVQTHTPPISNFNLIIIDECSMIGVDLFNYIRQACELFSGLLLFTGDPNQLPPVNETRASKSFSSPHKFALTEVLRHDGAVLNLATKVRTSRFVPQIGPDQGGGSRVATYATEDDLIEGWIEALARADEKGREQIILLCWVNKNRRAFNKKARAALFGEDIPEFMAGDKLVAIKPIEDPLKPGELLYGNNADIAVLSAEYVSNYSPQSAPHLTYSAWKLSVDQGRFLYVVADDDHARWLKDVSKLGKEISKQVETTKAHLDQVQAIYKNKRNPNRVSFNEVREAQKAAAEARSRWVEEYFPLKNAFADVDFGYALTIHKSQGSTYSQVYVFPDYMKSRNERLALLYVAVTRASSSVHHVDTTLKL